MARQSKPKIGDFEKSLKELETIVVRMEEGDQSLEASLKDFERGMVLAQICRSSLDTAEQKVEALIEKNGALQTEPFEPED
jgi:exodeoxyribonuclease VII small subunit